MELGFIFHWDAKKLSSQLCRLKAFHMFDEADINTVITVITV